MTGGDALLAAVLAAPDDDLPRLVYADWLEEHGEPDRASYIREGVDAGDRWVYGRAEQAGLGPHAHVVPATDLPRGLFDFADAPGGVEVVYRRGFAESVTCPAAAWLAHGDEVCRSHPVRAVRLTDWPLFGRSACPFARLVESEGVTEWEVAGKVVRLPAGSGIGQFFEARWPGVAVEMPAGRSAPPDDSHRVTGEILLSRLGGIGAETAAGMERRGSGLSRYLWQVEHGVEPPHDAEVG